MAAFGVMAAGPQHGLLLIDIDYFKAINDSFGHAAGNAVVGAVAARIEDAVGSGNVCARWGGDEFIVLLRDSSPQRLRATAHAVLSSVNGRPVMLPDGRTCGVTTSIGACLVVSGDTIDVASEMADTALYMAKRAGRNQVMVFDPHAVVRSQAINC